MGRPRRWCSDRCKARARRARSGLAAPWPPLAPPGYPTNPGVVRRRTAEALVALMEGDSGAPPDAQLAQALLEVSWLSFRLAALERQLAAPVAGSVSLLARLLRDAVRRSFPAAAKELAQ